MIQEQHSGNTERIFLQRLATLFAFLVPAAAMLQLPGITFFSHFWNVHFFANGSITFLALGAICCFPGRLKRLCQTLPSWIVGAFGILIAISMWHIFRHWSNYLLQDIGFTLMYAVLPLYGLVFRKELIRHLPLQLTIFWGLNLIACIIQKYYYRQILFGIPSNINWNAAFALFSGTGAVYYFWTLRKKQKIIAGLLIALVAIFTLKICLSTACRALIPGIMTAGLFAFFLYVKNVKCKRIVSFILLLGIAWSAFLFADITRDAKARQILLEDDRVYLAVTIPGMIADAPLFGHGAPSFEQAFLPYYRQDAFFRLKHVPDRIDHPHNDILFVAAGYGLIGLLCIYGIMFYALYKTCRNYRNESEIYGKILLFSFLILLVHAQLDLVFFQLPTAVFSLILPGILLGTGGEKEETNVAAVPYAPLWQWGGALVLCLGFTIAGLELYSSHMLWKARGVLMKHGPDHPDVWRYYERAYQTPQASPFTLFSVVSDYLWGNGRRPADFLKVCEKLDRTAIPDYAHINCTRGIAYQQTGDFKNAEKCYIREAELYPLHVIPYLRLMQFYRDIRNVHNFKVIEKMLLEVMQKRSLTAIDLQIIQRYPQYDTRPWDIPAELRVQMQSGTAN
ncbi:MAG: O-antigen ligase family protein [Lentisphaeria bacterium]|nr:O-antigen ligase family protein [Lentisphaeria bacterium]